MITFIPLLNPNYNFSASFFINNFEFYFRFSWNSREDIYLMDIGRSEDKYLIAGIPLIVGVQLNKKILNDMEGVLYLTSNKKGIEKANPNNLGKSVQMVHYG